MTNKDLIEDLLRKAIKSIPAQTEKEKELSSNIFDAANNYLLYGKLPND